MTGAGPPPSPGHPAGDAPGPGAPRGGPLLVLGKVAAILDTLEGAGWGLPPRRVSDLSGLPPTTCRRLLAGLVQEGFLERAGDRYHPGRRLVGWRLEGAGLPALARVSQPVLDRLRDETGETALFFVRDGLFRAVAALAPTRHVVVYAVALGQVLPLHAGSGGRVLLAFDPEAADEALRAGLVRHTPGTITDPARLRRVLARTRRAGYAQSVEERATGAAGVSAPAFGPDGRLVGALGIAGPTQRLTDPALARWRPAVLAAAQELSRLLGHAGPARGRREEG